MTEALDEHSFMECPRHGKRRPTIICRHLQHGTDRGFNVPDEPDPEMPWLRTAWCNACDGVLQQEGCWNDRSEDFAKILFVCEGCFEVVRKRNVLA